MTMTQGIEVYGDSHVQKKIDAAGDRRLTGVVGLLGADPNIEREVSLDEVDALAHQVADIAEEHRLNPDDMQTVLIARAAALATRKHYDG